MAGIYEIDGVRPVIDPSAFIHPTAVVIGDVCIGADCYIGPGASLRGDFGAIRIGRGSNVQDNCVMHSFPGRECALEEAGHIGHGAVLHGCRVQKFGFVGINAVVMDGATIGENAMVAAMAFIKADFELPPGELAAGVPATIIRPLTAQELEWKVHGLASYQHLARRSLQSLRATEPLTELDNPRPELQHGGSIALHELKRDS